MTQRGWAALDKRTDTIDMRTVGPTERLAQVNWLYVEARVPITDQWSDERIARTFRGYSHLVEAVEVDVMLAIAK